jgi:tetratricopeptide (TPR) repeat protein
MNFRLLLASISLALLAWCSAKSYANPLDHTDAENQTFKHTISECSAAIQTNPKDASAYYRRASAHYELGERTNAIDDINRAIGLNPKLADAYVIRALAVSTHGPGSAGPSAIKDYNEAIKLDPHGVLAYMNRGTAYLDKSDKYGQTIHDWETAIKLDPKIKLVEAYVFWDLGGLYHVTRQYQKEVDLWTFVMNNNAFNNYHGAYKEYLMCRASAYRELGQQQKAIDDYSNIIQLCPDDPVAYGERGLILADMKEDKKAVDDLDKAISLKSEDYRYYYSSGVLHGHFGQYKIDADNCSMAIKLHPPYSLATAEYLERAWACVHTMQWLKSGKDYATASRLLGIDAGQQIGEASSVFFHRYFGSSRGSH